MIKKFVVAVAMLGCSVAPADETKRNALILELGFYIKKCEQEVFVEGEVDEYWAWCIKFIEHLDLCANKEGVPNPFSERTHEQRGDWLYRMAVCTKESLKW